MISMSNAFIAKRTQQVEGFKQRLDRNRFVTLLDCRSTISRLALAFLVSCPKGCVFSFEPNFICQPAWDSVWPLLGVGHSEFQMTGMFDEATDQNIYINEKSVFLFLGGS